MGKIIIKKTNVYNSLVNRVGFMQEPTSIINDRFVINQNRCLGQGSFGRIYMGLDKKTNNEVAVKFETKIKGHNLLKQEALLLYNFRGGIGFTKVYYCGEIEKYNVLVIELLGKNLESYFNIHDRYDLLFKSVLFFFVFIYFVIDIFRIGLFF